MSDAELRAWLGQSQAGAIYLSGLDWAYRHGGNRDNMYRFAGEFLDSVVFNPDSWVDGHDRPEIFAAEHADEYPYVLDIDADAALHADKLDDCLQLLGVGVHRLELPAMLGLAPATVDRLLEVAS